MKLKLFTFFLVANISVALSAQILDGYKYAIVPNQYSFQKTADKYQLNSLTKFLFEKEGFKTIFEKDKLPSDLYQNSCLALKVNVSEDSNMLVTKLKIELIDCRNKIVFTSVEGKSKMKDIKRAYHEALRRAFQSVKAQDYDFDTNKTVFEEVETSKSLPNNNKVDQDVIEAKQETTDEKIQVAQGHMKEVQKIEKEIKVEKPSTQEIMYQLYAQEIPNGFQLVDSTPKVVYKLLKTSVTNYYIIEGISGIAYEKNGIWYAEYYFEGKLVKKELQIKF